MTNYLPKIDRWNSEPLDVHTWSEHPEIKALCDQLYDEAGLSVLEPKGNRKAKRTVKESLRVLILDLYVKWLKDPSISIGFSKSMKDYKVGSRYNTMASSFPERLSKWKSFSWMLAMLRNCRTSTAPTEQPVATRQGLGIRRP